MEIINKEQKQRHGCVTALLVLMLIGNSLTALMYLFATDIVAQGLPAGSPSYMLTILAVLGIINVAFSVMLFKWMKLGFWGFVASGIVAVAINLNIGLGVGQSLLGLVGIIILFGVLQIKKDDVTAWDNLD